MTTRVRKAQRQDSSDPHDRDVGIQEHEDDRIERTNSFMSVSQEWKMKSANRRPAWDRLG